MIRRLNAARLNGLEQFTETLTETSATLSRSALEQLLARRRRSPPADPKESKT